MKKIIIYGAGAYADVFYYEAIRTKQMEIAAFTVDKVYLNGRTQLHGLPLVAFDICNDLFPPAEYDMLVLCGYPEMRNRLNMFSRAKEKGYYLPNYISKDAIVEDGVAMGENNIIFPNVTLGHHGTLGDGNIIRQNVYIGHQFRIGNHTMISSGTTIGGDCMIEDLSFIALGATIINQIHIEAECLIGAGAVVVKNIEKYSKCIGNPARVISRHPDTGVIIK